MLEAFLRSHTVKSLKGEGREYPTGLDPYDVLADTCDLSHARFPTRWNGSLLLLLLPFFLSISIFLSISTFSHKIKFLIK
jgi:hypothetical protein